MARTLSALLQRGCSSSPWTATAGSAAYLAGSRVSDRDPLPGPDYYAVFPRGFVDAYPAHLHVNVREDCRGQALGARLIDAFRAYCLSQKTPGFHAVTAAGSPAAHFFGKCGLLPCAAADWRDRRLVFMGEAFGQFG